MFHSLRSTFVLACRRLALIPLFMSLCSTALPAQVTSGTISGTVKDQSGGYAANATVTVRDASTGVVRSVSTSEGGGFVAPNLPPGTYAITIELAGFKKLEKTGVIVSAADRLNAGDFVLTVGTTADEITVTAESGELQLQSNSGERSDLISGKQLNDVALNGRNVLDYMKLVPGVISSFDGHASGTGGLDSMNINGTRANQHEFTIDGASNVDTGNNGGTHVTINPDAIEEVKILTLHGILHLAGYDHEADRGEMARKEMQLRKKLGLPVGLMIFNRVPAVMTLQRN